MDENKFPELAAMLAKKNHQNKRALAVLQQAQRYDPENSGEMQACTQGDWIAVDDVVKAIQILQEGQQ